MGVLSCRSGVRFVFMALGTAIALLSAPSASAVQPILHYSFDAGTTTGASGSTVTDLGYTIAVPGNPLGMEKRLFGR